MITKENIAKLAQERIDELDNGTFLVDITIHSGNQIIVEIDNMTAGAAIKDCVSVSRNIEHNLDREVQDFSLEVASAGLSNGFKVHQQYVKSIGREVKVVFTDHGSEEGLLKTVTNENISIEKTEKVKIEGKKKKEIVTKTIDIPFSEIKETKVIISFK